MATNVKVFRIGTKDEEFAASNIEFVERMVEALLIGRKFEYACAAPVSNSDTVVLFVFSNDEEEKQKPQ